MDGIGIDGNQAYVPEGSLRESAPGNPGMAGQGGNSDTGALPEDGDPSKGTSALEASMQNQIGDAPGDGDTELLSEGSLPESSSDEDPMKDE